MITICLVTGGNRGIGGGRPVAAGAASVVWAALLPDSGPTGGFFRDGRPCAGNAVLVTLPW